MEAGVHSWQVASGGAVERNCEARRQGSKPIDRHPISACNEGQEALLLGLIEAMHHLPEPLDHLQTAADCVRETHQKLKL